MLTALVLFAALAQEKPYIESLPGSTVKFEMIPVQGGEIKIGDKSVVVKPFFIGATETPWEVFDQFLMSGEPSQPYDQTDFPPDAISRPSRSYILPDLGWGHQGYPVINVSFTNVDMFCRWLSSVTKRKYRVPTEAEWELACREGEVGDWKIAQDELEASEWYTANSDSLTHPVGKKSPNKLGLFDMLGNVGEWATDINGKPVLCGGDFSFDASLMTPFVRRYWSPKWQTTDPQLPKSRWWLSDGFFVGFRLACDS